VKNKMPKDEKFLADAQVSFATIRQLLAKAEGMASGLPSIPMKEENAPAVLMLSEIVAQIATEAKNAKAAMADVSAHLAGELMYESPDRKLFDEKGEFSITLDSHAKEILEDATDALLLKSHDNDE